MRTKALGIVLVAGLAIATAIPAQAFVHFLPLILLKGAGVFVGHSKLTDMQANHAYKTAPREGTCAQRHDALVQLMPDALRYAELARDVYDRGADMMVDRLETKDLGGGGTAVFDRNGQRYAEVRIDTVRREAVIVFQGTRPTVGGDLSADFLSLSGIASGYFRWANALVAKVKREHPGMRVVATGHSLGGGLAIYSVLHNPGVEAVVFNPAGLAWITWLTQSRTDRVRTNAAVTVFATRNTDHIDPITALSMAGRLVLPGRLVFVPSHTAGRIGLHGVATVITDLKRLAANNDAKADCDGVLASRAR